jgi:Flp pilus assembly protein TadG
MKVLLKRILNFKDESGAAIVIVAFALVAMIGFAAIAIDGGRLYLEKSKLQKAVDAAVLAGAHGLVTDSAQAKGMAQEISNKNGYDLEESDIDAVVKDYIEAEKTVQVPMTFAKVLNVDTVPVTASAKAIIAPLTTGHGIAPIAIEDDQVPDGTDLICTKDRLTDEDSTNGNANSGNPNSGSGNNSGNHSPGNCGFLQLDGPGASSLADAILNGGSFSVDQEYATTEPGGMWGQVQGAVDSLIQQDIDAGRTYCSNFEDANTSCSRVITIVVIDEWDAEGRDEVKVVGFAAYWIESFVLQGPDKYIKGRYKGAVSRGEIGEITEGGTWDEDNLLYGVKLVN